jgi:hypothetical protein
MNYSYEAIHNRDGIHYRVRDAADNRIATCHVEENAQTIVAALNARLPEALPTEEMSEEQKELRETVLKARSEGKIAMWLLPGELGITPLEDFLKQPADGILYDLNRGEECALSMAPNIRWVNDFAAAMVIRKLVEQRDALVSPQLLSTDKP